MLSRTVYSYISSLPRVHMFRNNSFNTTQNTTKTTIRSQKEQQRTKKTVSSFNHIKAKHLDNIKKNNKISLNINENPVFFIIIFVAEPSIVCGR